MRARSTRPDPLSKSTSRSTPIPAEMIEEARRRLGFIGLALGSIFLCLAVLNSILVQFIDIPELYQEAGASRVVLFALMIIASFGVYVMSRVPKLGTLMACGFGMLYEWLLVLSLGLTRYSLPRDPDFLPLGASFAGLIILVFPLVAPHANVRYAAFAAVSSACVDLLSLVICVALGYTMPTPASALALIMPTFLCAALAILPAMMLHRMSRDLARAKQMGSYRLTERIGSGGMGEVWRAEHRLLARPAAVKLLRPEALGSAGSGAVLQRFEREAQATAALCSPHVVHLYDFGVTNTGNFYYVMELLDGVDLDTLVEKHGPLSPERTIFLLRQVCDALMEAHQAGLIHRDIKPANIIVCRYGHYHDFVKVLDFGLVKYVDTPAQAQAQIKLTQDNATTGTPAYMAPEAALGIGQIDARTDIYALGCVGYWLLTGMMVFEGRNAMEVAVSHIQSEPVAPSRRAEHPIPPALDALILRCLRKQPDDRPQSAEELLSALDEIALTEPWTQAKAKAWWSAHGNEQPLAAHLAGSHESTSEHAGDRTDAALSEPGLGEHRLIPAR